jgi:hypothetical protein
MECKFYDQMEEIFSRELNVDSLAEDSLDNEEAAVWEPTLEVDQRKGKAKPYHTFKCSMSCLISTNPLPIVNNVFIGCLCLQLAVL